MKINVQKFLFIGTKSNLDNFLYDIQSAGIVQFVTKPKQIADLIGTTVYDVSRALKILAHYQDSSDWIAESEKGPKRQIVIRDPFHFAADIIHLHDELESIDSELKILSQKIEIEHNFGTIPWEELSHIEAQTSLRARFFEGSTNRDFDKTVPELLRIRESGEKSYFITFSLQPASHIPSGLREISRSDLQALDERKRQILQREEEIETLLKRKSRSHAALRSALLHEVNAARLNEAKSSHKSEMDNSIFVMTGWCPESELSMMSATAGRHAVISEHIVPEADETAPTYLKNQGFSRIGEDLVEIYDTPSNTDKDPSWWILGFFSLFFAMIVADGGYGLILLGIALYMKKRGVASAVGKRVLKLTALLGASCLAWGLLCHSFFGITFSETNPIRSSSLLTYMLEKRASYEIAQGPNSSDIKKWKELHPAESEISVNKLLYMQDQHGDSFSDRYADAIFFEAALFIGTIHLILGMLRYSGRNYANFGWILFVIGAYLYLPNYLHASSFLSYLFGIEAAAGARVGKDLMVAGISGAISYSVIKHGLRGLFECMVAVQLFADVLSYLRLYALALAGALVAKIINNAAASLPLVAAILLLLISHPINILLSIVGGIIHGLRLNFLEWYHYSFEGGGKKFTPLRKEPTD